MAKKINLTKEQTEAAAKAGREKTEKAYAQKAQAIAKGYGTNNAKSKVGKNRGQLPGVSEVLARNNPAFAALQQAGNAKKLTKGSDAISAGDIEWYKKILRGIDVGLTDFSKSLVSTADVVTSLGDEDGGPLQELWYMFGGDRIAEAAGDNALGIKGLNFKDNPIKAFNKLGEKEIEYRQKRDAAYADNPLYDYSAMTAETVAMMASTLMGGGLAAATDTAALANASRIGQAASKLSQTGAIAQNAIKQFATRPDAQVIFGSSFGSSYDEAKQDGADDLQALVYAALNGAGNAVTELGGVSELGGLQKLPEWVKKAVNKGDKSLLLNYAKSIGEEASEEIIQGILGRGLKSIYSDVPLYDANDENSIINPKAALEEATGAAVVSTLLGLPTTGINAAYRAKQRGETGQRLYGNSQRELVDEGLESERGTKSYELARKYDEKLNNGKQLSGNELYRLAQANEKAQVNEGTAVQSAPETQLNKESPALPHAALNREQQLSELRNYVAQRSEMSAPVNTNVSNNEAVSKSINNVAAKIDATPEFVSRVYNLNPVESPEAFEMAFDAVYQMGQQGANKESLTKVPVLNRAQAEIAYNMGASTTQAAVDNAAAQGDNVSTQVNNQINTQEVNNNGVRLRDSGQRLNGQNTEGQIPSVERGTVEAYTGTDSGRQSGYSTAQGKVGQKVVYNGVEQENVYYSGEDTESMKKGRELARSYGYNVQYFEGGNIKDSGGEFRGMVDTESKTVMVRSEHPDISAEQIMRHEMGHAAIAQGDISLDELRSAMLSDLSEKELSSAVEVYRHAYGDTISEAEAFEEMCCDALGKINIFAGTEHDSANYGKVQESFRKHTAETANKGRAPPKSGTMYSREVNGKKIAWIENSPLTAKELRNHKKVAAYIANHIGEAYTIIESGSKVYIGENLPSEYTQSEYTRALLRKNPKTLTAKNKAIGSFGEMIEIATNRRWEKTKHIANKDAKYGVYRYSTAFAFPVKQNNKITNIKSFDAELVILNSSDGKKYLYDIVNIKENTADELDLMKRDQIGGQDAPARRGASKGSIRDSCENVKKYSLEPTEEAKTNVKRAEEYFGTTYKIKEAGYITTDGKMLDFSGRHEGANGGYRTVDHREIGDALGEEYGGEDYSGAMVRFIGEGNIRISPEMGGINLSVLPNKAQRGTLDRYISNFRGEVILDIDDANGNTIASVEYPKYTHSSVVLKDVDDYFNKGKTPEAFTRYSREPESITELRRQNETMLAQATNEDAANENERGLIKDYKRQYDKVSGIAEKLNTARQEVLTAENGGDKNAIATARNRFTLLSRKYAEEHRKLSDYVNIKALDNVLTRVKDRTAENPLPEGMGAASAEFTGEETRGERWVTEAQGKGNNALHPISREQEANLAEQQHRAPQEIPKEDLSGKLTSKHVSTLANSGVTPAEFSDALREDAAQGKFSHIAYSDEAALKKAEITIEANGWEQALADYKAQINAGKVSKDNTVMGIALYNNAVNSGDYATALDIASLMVKNSTNTAQSLQAMRILNKLSPECKLYLAAKSVETIEEDLNEKYKDNKADIHVDKVLYDEYGKALRSGDEDGIKTAWAKIEQSVAQQIDATWYEKLNNFRYLAMLGNPRTHVRNIVGNAFFVPVRAVKNTIAYGLENVADSKVNGGIERSKAMLNRNNANDVALIKYAMTDYEAVQETILSGGKYVDTFQGIDKKRTIYKTKILEAARKGNSNLLDAEDAWFCKPAYANALAKWYKANGITAEQLNTGKVPESTIIKAQTVTIKEAQKATYRDTNRFSAMVSRLGKVDNKIASALIEGVLPFKKTPANILVRAVEYSPVGLIKSLAVDTKKVKAYVNGDVENGMSPAQFIDDVSAGLTGTALVGLGVLLASWGLFSGSPGDDDKQNKFDELGGSQNYALNIGGLSITLDWLAPESMPLFVGVELYNSLSGKSEDNGFVQNLMSSVMSLSTPMFEMSMLQSVNDLFDNLRYIKQGQGAFRIVTSMATNYISQYFPTLFGQVERAFGENQRETTYIDRNSNVGSELQYMWGKIANKIPFYDFSQIPYIDAWGRTEETGNLFERVLNNFVNPAYVKKERSTEIDGELKRLYDLGETGVYPGRAAVKTKINGEFLTAEEYVKYATVRGRTSYDLAKKIINSSAYSRASDAEKAYMLSYVYKYADQIAKYEVNNENDKVYDWQMAAYKSSNPAQGIIDHAQEYYKRKENDES